MFVEPPEMIEQDAGKNFVAAAFEFNATMLHIRTKSIAVESANSRLL